VARRKVEWRAPLFVALAIALVLAFLNVDGLREWTGRDSDSGAARQPVPTVGPETASPTAAPPPVDPEQPTVDRPWAGSPAEGWPNGPDALVLPTDPQAVGVFSATQVAAQLKLVKDYLVAANLDPKVLAGARPDAALALLDPQERAAAEKALAKPTQESSGTDWFSRFDPRDAIPATDTVKVQGRISVEGDGEKGVLVHTDVTYVYALRPGPEAAKRAASAKPSAPAPAASAGAVKPVGLVRPAADVPGDTWTARTIVRRVETFRFHDPAQYRTDPKKLVFKEAKSSFGNSECSASDGYFHPQFDQFAAVAPDPQQSGPTEDPYDRSREPRQDGACGTVSRS
jgi:hypothetical protein